MDERELVHVKEYHRHLVEISTQERTLRQSRSVRRDSRGNGLLRMIIYLISFGHRIGAARLKEIEKTGNLNRELTR